MKSKLLLIIALSIPLLAQGVGPDSPKHKRYRVVMLEPDRTLNSYPAGWLFFSPLSNQGRIGVWESAQPSELPNVPPFPVQGPNESYTWTDGKRTNFQGLQPAGGTTYINWINHWGLAAGYATNGKTDPLVGGLEVNAVIWAPDGHIFDLGTMGGYQSTAIWINDFGQVSGWVENRTPDPYSMGAGAQTQGFIWQNGVMRLLGTLGGPDSEGKFINNLGQVSGHSYTSDIPNSITGVPPADPFVWENGKMTDINPGNFGGAQGGTNFLNNRGEVAGFGTTPGEAGAHAFLWHKGVLTDLFTIGNLGNFNAAYYVNEEGHVIGSSGNGSLLTGVLQFQSVLWRGHEFIDIGALPGDTCRQPYFISSHDQVVVASATD
jgi:uncharacterized membrane protein